MVIASLGGVAVVAGGFLVLKRKKMARKFFVSLGGDVGVVGFAVNLVSGRGLCWAILKSHCHLCSWADHRMDRTDPLANCQNNSFEEA
nr:hypothetical protein [Candidatus Njordarchaeota archaeon]